MLNLKTGSHIWVSRFEFWLSRKYLMQYLTYSPSTFPSTLTVLKAIQQCFVFDLDKHFSINLGIRTKWDITCLFVCLESTEGAESRGPSEEEDEWAGVLAAPALSHYPFPRPQQTRKGKVFIPCCHTLHPWSCNTWVSPLERDMTLSLKRLAMDVI